MEIRQSLEANFLTCRHCQQPYRKPKVLVCLHTFCQACLEQILNKQKVDAESKELEANKRYYTSTALNTDYRSSYRKKWSSKFRAGGYDSSLTSSHNSSYPFYSSRTKSIQCPSCEKETAVPPGGVCELPTDQLADRLANMVDRMPTFPVCDVCTTQPLFSENGLVDTLKSSTVNNHFNDKKASSSEESDDTGWSLSSRSVANGQNGSQRRSRLKCKSNNVTRAKSQGPRPAIAACLECAKRLCSDCRETHVSMPVTANHVLLRLDQMDDLKCDRHPRELRRFFCLTCRRHICVVCTFEQSSTTDAANHDGHEIMSIREAVTSYQTQLGQNSTQTQAQIRQIGSLLNSLHACETGMQSLYKIIDAAGKAYTEQIVQQQNALRATVDKLAGISLKVLGNECERLNQAANEWYEFLNDDSITSRLDLMDPLEALAEAGPMLDRVSRCLRLASEPLHADMARQPFLSQLTAAEESVMKNGDSGVVSSQSSSPQSTTDATSNAESGRALYWRSKLGQFQMGVLNFGRIMTDRELAAEAMALASRFVTTFVQTGPELVKALPPAKGAQRHRAVQVNLFGINLDDRSTQTEPISFNMSNGKVSRVDVGTQYVSADINPPVVMYRSSKQMIVQK